MIRCIGEGVPVCLVTYVPQWQVIFGSCQDRSKEHDLQDRSPGRGRTERLHKNFDTQYDELTKHSITYKQQSVSLSRYVSSLMQLSIRSLSTQRSCRVSIPHWLTLKDHPWVLDDKSKTVMHHLGNCWAAGYFFLGYQVPKQDYEPLDDFLLVVYTDVEWIVESILQAPLHGFLDEPSRQSRLTDWLTLTAPKYKQLRKSGRLCL